MEDDEPSSFSESVPLEENEERSDSLTDPRGDLDPLMIQEGVVENVVLTSMVETEEEDNKPEVPVAAEMSTFDLSQYPHEIGSDAIIKEEQEIGTDAIIKEELNISAHEQVSEIVTADEQQSLPQQFIILTRPADEMAGQVEASDIVAHKYFQIEGTDGQTYFLAVTDEEVTKFIATEPVKGIQSQQIVPAKNTKSGRTKIASSSALASTLPSSSPSTSSSAPSSSAASSRHKVSNTDSINQAWFTTRDDKNALHKEGHQWKQGQWTKEEVDVLKTNIDNYCKDHGIKDAAEVVFEMSKDERKDFYRTIALGIQRPLFSVYRRVTRMYDRKNHRGKYTPTEMKNLRGLRAQHGNDWAAIGLALGRSASSVKDKCRLMKDNCNSGKWYPDEEARLASAVHKLTGVKPSESITTGLSWANVAEHVGTRSEKQCRTKWLNYLNWKQQGGSDWTRDDDSILIEKVSKLNVNNDSEIDWATLAKNWSSVRSPQWLRGKWWALKRHIPDYNKLSYPELLANMRKLLSWSLKPKNGVRPMKLEMKGQQEVEGTAGFLKSCVPVSITADPEGNGLSLSYCPSDEEGYQYEVLQQWSPQVITQVAQNSSTVEGTQVINGTPGHIFVQTIAGLSEGIQVSGQQQVIISAGNLNSGEVKTDHEEAMTLHLSDNVSQSEQEIRVLTDSDNLQDATGIAMTFDPGEGQEIIAVSEFSSQSDGSSDAHMMSHDVFETVTSESGGDLVMGVTSPTRANCLMTSLKDPILMSSSDVECEKHPNTLSDEHTEMIA